MSNAMTRLAATYRARVVETLQNPRIRAQLQVVLTSPEAETLIAMVRSSLAGVPDTAVPKTGVPDTGVHGTAGQDSSPHEVEQPPAPSQDAPSSEITQDWSLPPTQVMDRSTIEAAIQPQTQATRARRSRSGGRSSR